MRDFNFEDHSSKGRRKPSRNGPRRNSDRSSRRDFRPRTSEHQAKHTATCDACGKECEVPFRPTAGKSVYCDDCFRNNKNQGSGNNISSRGLSEINEKLDKILELLSEN